MSKPDRKALMRKSLEGGETVDRRFAAAEEAMANRPKGLLAPAAEERFSAETAPAEGSGPLARVPIDKVHDNPFNARQIYDPEAIRELASSLATRGQLVPAPAIVHPTLPGHYILIDGHYRKRALAAAGKKEIDCLIQDVTDDLELYRRSFLINEQRNAQSPLDNAMAWRRLLDDGLVESADAIGEMLGVSKANVAKTMAFLKLPEAALEKIREAPGKFGLAIGYEISRCAQAMEEGDLLALMARVVAEDLSSRQVEAIRAHIEAKPGRKPKEVSRQYKLREGQAQIGFIKEWDSGKVALEVRILDPKAREALIEDLKRRFGIEAA